MTSVNYRKNLQVIIQVNFVGSEVANLKVVKFSARRLMS